MYIDCGGELTFTGHIDIRGNDGVDGGSDDRWRYQTGGGGSGGMAIVTAGSIGVNTGTVNVSGGVGGVGKISPGHRRAFHCF